MSDDKKPAGGEYVIDKPHKYVTPVISKDMTDKWKATPTVAGKKVSTLDAASKELEKTLKQKGIIK